MVRNLQQQLQEKLGEQCDGGVASERRVRVAISRVGGRWAEPVIRLCHALGRAARAGLLAARRARGVPLFDLLKTVLWYMVRARLVTWP